MELAHMILVPEKAQDFQLASWGDTGELMYGPSLKLSSPETQEKPSFYRRLKARKH